MLFLGEWCRLYSRRHRLSGLDAIVLPYHWNDSLKLQRDRQYLANLHEVLLVELGNELNERHRSDHSPLYWRILLGPWLGFFTQTLFDRWETVQSAIRTHDLSGTILLRGLSEARVPRDMTDYLHLGNGHQWNHHLFARILEEFTDLSCVARDFGDVGKTGSTEDVPPFPNRKQRLVAAYSSGAAALARSSEVFIINSCLRSLRDELALQWRLGQVPRINTAPSVETQNPSSECRDWMLGVPSSDGFELCLRSLLPQQIPTAYLEGFSTLCAQAASLRWPSRPRVVFTSASHFYDDLFKAWCAQRVEEGSRLVIGQHGGHVGIGWSFPHDHQVAVADRFISWGWGSQGHPKVEPVGMLKAPVLPKRSEAEKELAVLVIGNETPQIATISSAVLSSQYLEYLEDQYSFVDALVGPVRSALTVRLPRDELDWEQADRWGDRIPSACLDDGRRPILELLAEAKLSIATNNGSTFLESIFLDVPTVIYWDTSRWEILETARPFFDELSDVGVFHETPQAAAEHISNIWPDVDSWWQSEDVAVAVTRFSRQFCNRSTDVLEDVKRCLIAEAAKSCAR